VKNRWLAAAIAWIVVVAAVCGWLAYDYSLRLDHFLLLFGVFGVAPVVLVWGIRKIVTWLPRRVLIALASAVATLAAGYWIVFELEPLAYAGVSYETPPSCAGSDAERARGNSVVSEWADGTLTVRTSICANCADRIGGVSAQVLGERILLKVRIASGDMHAACDCARPLIVRLANLPKRDYRILGVPSYSYCI